MMHMTFYWGRNVTILFDGWKTTTWLGYGLSLVAVFLFAAFYQYMENIRIRLQTAFSSKPPTAGGVQAPLLSLAPAAKIGCCRKLAVGTVFGFNAAIGYFLMLAVMSFNAGVFIAIVVGLGIGYAAFRNEGEIVAVVENPCACA